MPQSHSPFNSPSTSKSAQAFSPFKNSQNAATLLGKGVPVTVNSKKGKNHQNSTNNANESHDDVTSSPKANKSTGGGGNRSISLSSNGASPYSSKVISSPLANQKTAAEAGGLLPRDLEVTFHRKLRTFLQYYTSCAHAWEEVATYDGLKWGKEAVDSWSDLEAARELGSKTDANRPKVRSAKASKSVTSTLQDPLAMDPILGPGGLRERRIANALVRIERAEAGLSDVLSRLDKYLNKLVQTSEAIGALLVEAAKSKGPEFVFRDPMWGTWTMERLVVAVTELTPSYTLSSSHLTLLVPLMVRPQPSGSNSDSKRISKATLTSCSSNDSQDKDPVAHRRNAYEEWISLPYLPTKGRGSLAWLEQVCDVEVGRYRDHS